MPGCGAAGRLMIDRAKTARIMKEIADAAVAAGRGVAEVAERPPRAVGGVLRDLPQQRADAAAAQDVPQGPGAAPVPGPRGGNRNPDPPSENRPVPKPSELPPGVLKKPPASGPPGRRPQVPKPSELPPGALKRPAPAAQRYGLWGERSPDGAIRLREGAPDPRSIRMPKAIQSHTLTGHKDRNDNWSGGHAPGTGIPNKSEFPVGWTHRDIIDRIESVARNPDKEPVRTDNGRWVARGVREDVLIKAVIYSDGIILTGHPIRGRGVMRNDEHGIPHPVDGT
jgi:hypothetical protein